MFGHKSFYAHMLIVVALTVVNFFVFVELYLKRVSLVLGNILIQDSPICPLSFAYKAGPYIDQGGSKRKVSNFQNFQQKHKY